MIKVITIEDLCALIHKTTLKTFILKLIDSLEQDYARWNEFQKSPRHATHYPQGVIELMPIADQTYYSFKYVNGHPNNPAHKKLNVVAIGLLADVMTGYPILLSEMTLLTAIRTAAMSALASKYLAVKGNKTFGIIGTGAQSEFQTLAHHFALGVSEIYYYDTDEKAMQKFASNLTPFPLQLHPCKNAQEVAEKSALITTATAAKARAKILLRPWVKPGTHINAIGGDCPGKTELDPALGDVVKIFVEQLEQTKVEGEIQYFGANRVFAEMWEVITKKKRGRESAQEITVFDSVGFALEDYSTLRMLYALAEEHHAGHMLDLIPELNDPKDLFSLLARKKEK